MSINVKSVEPRYIMIKEDIYKALSPNEMSIYQALRFHADYRKEESTVKISSKSLALESKVSVRTLFTNLTKLETIHFLIRRIEVPGSYSKYLVSQTLQYFLNQEGVQEMQRGVQEMQRGVQEMHTNIINTSNNSSNKPLKPLVVTNKNIEKEELKEKKKCKKSSKKATDEQCREFFVIWNRIMGNHLSKINASLTKARPIVKWWLNLDDGKTKFEAYLENIFKYYKLWAFNSWGDGSTNNFFSICRGANVEQVSDGIIKNDAQRNANKPAGKQ